MRLGIMFSFTISSSILLIFLFSFLPNNITAEPILIDRFCSEIAGNFIFDSPYEANLEMVLADLTARASASNFNATSSGTDLDSVFGLYYCRFLFQSECEECIMTAAQEIQEFCPTYMEATAYYMGCTLRYAKHSIVSVVEKTPITDFHIAEAVPDPDEFRPAMNEAMNTAIQMAAFGTDPSMLGHGLIDSSLPSGANLTCIAQCRLDVTDLPCENCLRAALVFIPDCCDGRLMTWIFLPGCDLMYLVTLLNDTSNTAYPLPPRSPPPPVKQITPVLPPRQTTGKEGINKTKVIIITSISAAISLALFVLILLYLRRRRNLLTKKVLEKDEDVISMSDSLRYNLSTLSIATGSFSEENKLGRGGFGTVYKGTLPSGQEIAVKRLAKNSGQGEVEFKNEALIVAKLQHRNLVRLLGFCLEKDERLLVYEFVQNRSLDYFLFDAARRVLLDWETRYKIIGGVVRGLLYLHEDSRLRIIHRDLKASNILLDSEMNPKIADFGLARLFQIGQTHADTRRIVGTYGYMAPEYAMNGFFSVKSDVYSLGVLIFEIICGRKNNGFRSEDGDDMEDLVTCVWRNWKENTLIKIVDPKIFSSSRPDIMRCIHIGLLCVQERVEDRPTTSLVVSMFSSHSFSLPTPIGPTYTLHGSMSVQSESKSLDWTTKEASIMQKFSPR